MDFDSDPSINPTWLGRTVVQRVDERLDLFQAIIEGLGSIVAQNAQTEPAPGAAEDDPQSQAARGTQNAPQGQGNEPQPQAGFLLFRLSCIRQLTRNSRRTDGDIDGNLPKAPFLSRYVLSTSTSFDVAFTVRNSIIKRPPFFVRDQTSAMPPLTVFRYRTSNKPRVVSCNLIV